MKSDESTLLNNHYFTHENKKILVERVKNSDDKFVFKRENIPVWHEETLLNKFFKKGVWSIAWLITLSQMYNVYSEKQIFTMEGFKTATSETWYVYVSIFVPLVFLPAIALIMFLAIEFISIIFIDSRKPQYTTSHIVKLSHNIQKQLKNFDAEQIFRYFELRDEARSKAEKINELEILLVKTSNDFAFRNDTKIRITNLRNNIQHLQESADRILIEEAKKLENKVLEKEKQLENKAENQVLQILSNNSGTLLSDRQAA